MSSLTEITSESDFATHLTSLPPTTVAVLYFHTTWAAPCTQMRTVISTIAAQYSPTTPPSTTFLSINAEELPDISEDYDVTAVPFVVVLRGGQILESVSGSDAVEVRTAIEKHAGGGTSSATGAATTGSKASIPPPLSAESRDQAPTTATQAPESAENSKEALFARLGELVKAAPVMLFMKGSPSEPQCGFSRQLVGILRERSVKYGFFNILADEEVRQGLKEFAEWPTFPQLWVSGELVGGLDIVREELENDPSFLDQFSANKAAAAAA